jgi:hypothetical protein
LGARSRKRGRTAGEAAAQPFVEPPAPKLRGEARNAEIRAGLEPLAPGERPGPVTVAAIVAALLGLSNIGLVIGGYRLKHDGGSAGGGILFGVILLVAAGGMWKARYWAVLGFQALLAFTALIGFLSLLVASNVLAAVLSVAVLSGSGVLFYRLIRAMARIQMPERAPRR